jgi:2-dehydro-3-deoxyphosphooctonate aldolase (KDO 8-P synthase)
MNINTIPQIKNTDSGNFFVLAGPCAIEGEEMAMRIAEKLVTITDKLEIPYVFKGSFKKANRSRIDSFSGIGDEKALKILRKVSETFHIPTVTDIHTNEDAALAAEYVDVLQIPAFLCRQTDLLLAAAATGLAINIKKGQFLAPWDMKNVAEKIASAGNDRIMLCERGTTHGYNTLVVDMQSLPIMAETGYPIVFDATHSVQRPGGQGNSSGGNRLMVPYLARAAVATGCVAAVFIETHKDPDNAPSDGPNMVKLSELKNMLIQIQTIDQVTKDML